MSGAVHPLPHMHPWHARNNFALTGNTISNLHKYWHYIPRNILDILATFKIL
jgi:hypothetical protein